MNKILVTGGAGFIGSHLCKRLLEEENKVICLDNMFTGTYDNILPYFNNEKFEFVNADVINPLQFDVDMIYNLACPASPIHYQCNPIMTTKTSVLGAINVLELAKRLNAKVLQASTSEIYGDPIVHPQLENYRGNVNTIGPRACYDEGKRVAETLFFDYKRQYGVDIRVVRIFNTYGPGMLKNDGRVVSNFIVQALHNKDITIYGDGTQTRSFCYVDDLVEGMISAMNKDGFSGPVNLGNPCEITILELAQMIIKKTNSSSNLVFKAKPEDDPNKRKPDISFAKKMLNWEPHISIDGGLDKTIEYLKNKQGGIFFMANGRKTTDKFRDKNLKQFFSFDFQKTLIQRAQCLDNTFEDNLLGYSKLFLTEFYIAKSNDKISHEKTVKIIDNYLNDDDDSNDDLNGIANYFYHILKCYKSWVSLKGEMAFENIKDILSSKVCNESFLDDEMYKKVINSSYNTNDNIFYRGRYSKNRLKKMDMFHIPFKESYKIKNQRYSLTGIPVLYLANTPQTVAYELEAEKGESIFTDFYVSQYKFCGNKEISFLDLRIQLLEDGHEKYSIYDIKNECDFKKFVQRFILSCVCSFPAIHRNDCFVEEYVIPQLVTQEVKRIKKFDGICYNSSLHNDIECINFILFTDRKMDEGVDKNLRKKFEITNPITAKDILPGYNSDFVNSEMCIKSITQYYNKLNQEIRQSTNELCESNFLKIVNKQYAKLEEIYKEKE